MFEINDDILDKVADLQRKGIFPFQSGKWPIISIDVANVASITFTSIFVGDDGVIIEYADLTEDL